MNKMRQIISALILIALTTPLSAALNVDFTYDVVDSESYEEKDDGDMPYPRVYHTLYIVVTGVKDNVTDLTIKGSYSETKKPNNPRWEPTHYYEYYVVGIADNAFDGNTTLKSARVSFRPDKGYGMGNSPFSSCTALEEVYITVPDIPGSTFWNCTRLKTVTLNKGVKSIGYQAFYNTAIESITLPETLDSRAMRAFENCSKLKSVTFDHCAVKEIPASLFSNCPALTSLTLPEGVTSLKPTIASGGNMSYIKLPSTIREIGMGMVMTKTPLTVECGVFDPADITLESLAFWFNSDDFSFTSQCTLIVPPGSKELYKAAKQWKSFGTIIEKTYDGSFCGTPYVDVFDYAYMNYNYASGNRPNKFDINQDGNINSADFTALGNLLLDAIYPPRTSFYTAAMLKETPSLELAINANTIGNGKYATIQMDLSTDKAISAVQFDLRLPQGAYITSTTGSDKNYYTVYGRISNDTFRVLAVPYGNNGPDSYNTVTGDTKLVKIGLRGMSDDYQGEVEVSNIILANKNTEYFAEPFTFTIVKNGDLNLDEEVNSADVSRLYSTLIGGSTDIRYDVNGDGSVNSGDVSVLYSIILE